MRDQDPTRGLLDQVLGWALTLVLVAVMVRWSFAILRPLLPAIVLLAIVVVVVRWWLGYSRSRW